MGAAAILPLVASVASSAIGALLTPRMSMPDTPMLPEPPQLEGLPEAPAVVDPNADAQEVSSASALSEQKRLQQLAQYNASLNKKGNLSSTTTGPRTLLGD